MAWKVLLYESKSGKQPLADFISALQPDTQAKVINKINLLAEFGPQLIMPHTKPIGNSLYELRVRSKEEVRIIYLYQIGDTIVLSHGFKKKTMAIFEKI